MSKKSVKELVEAAKVKAQVEAELSKDKDYQTLISANKTAAKVADAQLSAKLWSNQAYCVAKLNDGVSKARLALQVAECTRADRLQSKIADRLAMAQIEADLSDEEKKQLGIETEQERAAREESAKKAQAELEQSELEQPQA